MAAVQAPIDILAHPGLITDEEALIAIKNGICLEVSARKGHSLTNGHVVNVARRCKAALILNTDTHAPGDLLTKDKAIKIALGAGLSDKEVQKMFKKSESIVKKVQS
jgi:histidinol phosphatase-like PHP family hydrolase